MHTAYIPLTSRRTGAEGYIKTAGTGARLGARGLPHGATCHIVAFGEGDAQITQTVAADENGRLSCECPVGELCLTDEGGLTLLQTGEDRQLAWRARQAVRNEIKRETKREDTIVAAKEQAPPEPAPEQDVKIVEKETPTPVIAPVQETPDPDAYLFAMPDTPPIDALPVLRWPGSVRDLQVYFDTLNPVAAFDAPGWRFVRVPMRKLGYCALGIRAQDSVVRQVAYAIPDAHNNAPPPGLHGYRWQLGLDGTGYWTLWKNVDDAEESTARLAAT